MVLGSERLRVVHLARDGRVLGVTERTGTASRVALPLRAIVADALRLGADALLVSHTHPDGDPTPSRLDLLATRHLVAATAPLGIRVHDHVVEATGQCASFRAAGLL